MFSPKKRGTRTRAMAPRPRRSDSADSSQSRPTRRTGGFSERPRNHAPEAASRPTRRAGGFSERPYSNRPDAHKRPTRRTSNLQAAFEERISVPPFIPTEGHVTVKRTLRSRKTTENQETGVGMRLNKFLAHAGLFARRKAGDEVKAGKVTVNGQVLTDPSYTVAAGDKITYDGQPVSIVDKPVYYLMNKAKDVITTNDDERGRTTVLDIIKSKVKQRVYPVGRLDRNTTGLLLITNDGELANRLSHPSSKVPKVYHVVLDRPLKPDHFEKIKAGIELEDGLVEVDDISYLPLKPHNEIGIEIHSGRNRIVRRIFEHFGYEIVKLDRVYYAGLTKKELARGHFRPLTHQEIIMLKHFVK